MSPTHMLPGLLFWVTGASIGQPPARYAEAKLSSLRDEFASCKSTLDQFVNDFNGGPMTGGDLVISAPNGIGKTYLGVALTRAIAEKGYKALYLSQEYLLVQMLEHDARDADNILEVVSAYDFVFVDDFGAKSTMMSHEEACLMMFRLIDARYALCLPTVYATHLAAGDVKNGFGVMARSFSRIDGRIISVVDEVLA